LETAIARLQAADLKAVHQKFTAPNNGVLAIYGDVRADEVKAAVEKVFANWKSSKNSEFKIQDSELKESKRVEEIRDKKQAVVVIGFLGTTVYNDDRYALDLLQEACSDLGSRLFLRVREKLGLAYYVGAQNFTGLVPGYFAFYAGTEPTKAAQVEQEFLNEAELLRTEGLSEEELKRAKAKIIGQKKISRQDLGHLASTTALDELYGLGFQQAELDDAKFEALTVEQIKAVAQKYLKPGALVVAVVKPEEK
jgi:zinc protease